MWICSCKPARVRAPVTARWWATLTLVGGLFSGTWLSASRCQADQTPVLPLSPVTLRRLDLVDFRGKSYSLDEFVSQRWLVVAVLGTECPLAKLYTQRLITLHQQFAPRGVGFLAVDANAQDSLAEMRAFARRQQLPFPFLKDEGTRVADQLGATRTPEVFLLDEQRQVRYSGRIDDQYGVGYVRNSAQQQFLRKALEELLAGRDVSHPHEPASGCLIGRRRPVDEASPVTYSQQVSRILQRHCVECHRPGEIGPMPLTDYAEVAGWADMILEVLDEGIMPPWHANPAFGRFSNDRSMSPEDREQIRHWVAAGAPEGDPDELPAPAEYTIGWQLPREPELILPMNDHPFQVPAEGDVKYQYFRVDPGFDSDRWISAAEIQPGNRAVVHHVLIFVRPKGSRQRMEGERGFLVGYVPGTRVRPYPAGLAKRIPAHSELIFQVHYTPVGTPQSDLTRVGFIFADPAAVTHEVQTTSAVQARLRIPPGEANYPASATTPEQLPECQLLVMSPHMHLRGKSFRYEAIYPDGNREILLDVPRYDFNWQTAYWLAEPKSLPTGTRIHCEAVFDNSPENLNNPDPTAWVRWGEQTYDEMMIGYFDVVVPREAGDRVGGTSGRQEPQDTTLIYTASRISDSDGVSLGTARIDFNREVLPILADNCFACHGPDATQREADLRLDQREAALAAGALAPGDPAASTLIERITSTDDDLRMPPAESHKSLTRDQQQVLRDWIAQGAEYQQHWAYRAPVKPSLAPGTHPVDALVRARLDQIDLAPSPEADRRTLIRRLYWDLIGLPPTPAEVRAFQEEASPDAYEQLVERLLASPHYGERMAQMWLDLVRYADTIGYHSDNPRNVWPYRDWVIQSFNDNKPFDRFTVEQIAGDLLPDANQETRVGSAFNRLLLSTEEGGAQAKDYEVRMMTDRVRAIGTVWLGQTTGCAQCHDHKFDPFTQRDFYSLGAFFADIEEPILGRREEGMLVMTAAEESERMERDQARLRAQQLLEEKAPHLDAAQQQWEADVAFHGATLPELSPDSEATPAEKERAKAVAALLHISAAERSAEQLQTIQDYFRQRVTRLFEAERRAVTQTEETFQHFLATLPRCLVSVSTPEKRTVRLLARGDWMDETGEVMRPALPHFLPQPATADRELNRLDLAHWLVSEENPLTARAMVNRLWTQFFGMGLSRVLDDLGAQGEAPVNPELLDWLACEFMDSGWDVKHVVRTIVTSAAYRQVSTVTPELEAVDPYNREHARQSAFRLNAEQVRDQALAVAGLLVPDVGGPSVKPYQPAGYWENLNFPPREYVADQGPAQYRRGLYTWWQRSFPHPSLVAFDAPSREECVAERNRSNIPQHALVLLNDPTYVEAARMLAARVLLECSSDRDERLTWIWWQVLLRPPREAELAVARSLWQQQADHYAQDTEAARQLLSVGYAPVPQSLDPVELAAWTHVARVLLNLHEAITRS